MREEAKTAAAANAEGGGGDNGAADIEGDEDVVSLKVRLFYLSVRQYSKKVLQH